MTGRSARELEELQRVVHVQLPVLAWAGEEHAADAWEKLVDTITGAATATGLALAIASFQATLLRDTMKAPDGGFFSMEIVGGDGPTDPRIRAHQVLTCVLNKDYGMAADLFLAGGPDHAPKFFSAQVALLRSLATSHRTGGGGGV